MTTTPVQQHIKDIVDPQERASVIEYLFNNLQFQLKPSPPSPPTQTGVDSTIIETTTATATSPTTTTTTTKYHEGYLHYTQFPKKNVQLFYRHYEQTSPRAIIFLFHGAGSISEFVAPLANHLRDLNFEVFAMDQMCHGRTRYIKKKQKQKSDEDNKLLPPPDCLVDRFEHFHTLIWFFIRQMMTTHASRLNHLPLFLWGESMGGATVLTSLLNHQAYEDLYSKITGVVVSAPAIEIPNKPNACVTFVLSCLANSFPNMKPLPHDPKTHSRIERFAEYYDKHENTVAPLPLKLMKVILDMSNYLNKNIDKIDIPMLILHGSKDITVDISGSKKLFEVNKNQDKQFVVYDESLHALINEYTTVHVINTISDWMLKRCTTTVTATETAAAAATETGENHQIINEDTSITHDVQTN